MSFIPLLLFVGLTTAITTYFTTKTGYTRHAVKTLQLINNELILYIQDQFEILTINSEINNANISFESLSKASIESIKQRSAIYLSQPSDILVTYDYTSDESPVLFLPDTIEFVPPSLEYSTQILQPTWIRKEIGEGVYIGYENYISENQWYLFLGEEESAFYKDINEVTSLNVIIIIITSILAIVLVVIVVNIIVNGINNVKNAMKVIIQEGDFSQQIPIVSDDEVGQLTNTFNLMLQELDGTYQQIRNYAFKAVLAQHDEKKLRTVFQKYVPNDIINNLLERPNELLQGNNKDVAIFFSDIRSFTTISEMMTPDELVKDLNIYFDLLVSTISECGGIVDKYIGDAVMAIFGAPLERGNEPAMTLFAALEIQEKLKKYNKKRKDEGKPIFQTGIGIHYGLATVGNIGTDQKMDYTVIGDAVNFSSRLEGLTKFYKCDVLFSRTIFQSIADIYPTRFVDIVQVKGKTHGEGIYTSHKHLTPNEVAAWDLYHEGIGLYFKQQFEQAKTKFRATLEKLPNDFLAQMYYDRCIQHIKTPPPANWDGVTELTEK